MNCSAVQLRISCMMMFIALMAYVRNEIVYKNNNPHLLVYIAAMLTVAQLAGCGSGGGADLATAGTTGAGTNTAVATETPASTADPAGTNNVSLTATPTATTGPTCAVVGQVQAMTADPNTGAVDVSEYCLELINGYRAQKGLKPYYLHSTAATDVCCQAAEAKTVAESGKHENGKCGWQSQGLCAGGRNPDGTVQGSMDWCPKLFYREGPATPPSTNHYTAMMEEKPRGIMCSFYGMSRDRHSIVVNYY